MRTGLALGIAALIAIALVAIYFATLPLPPTQTTPIVTTPTTTTPTATTPPATTQTTPTPTATTPTPTPAPTTTPTPTPTPSPTTPAPSACTTLSVVTRHPTEILEAARSLFLKSEVAKKHGIKDIKFMRLPSAQWRALIQNGQVDVAWGGGPTVFDSLYKDGLLLPLEGPEVKAALAQIPKTMAGMPMMRTGPDGKVYWVAWTVSSFGITINTKVLRQLGLPEPKTWADLASFEYGEGVIKGFPITGLVNLPASTSITRIAQIILQAYGWEEGWRIITLTAANGRIFDRSERVRDSVIAGEIGAGWTIDFFGYTAQLQNPDTKYVIPPDTSVNGDPIAVVKNTKCRDAAEAFVAWAITDGERIVFDPKINRMPANPNAFNTPEGRQRPDLKTIYDYMLTLKTIDFNDTLAVAMENVVMYYFQAAIYDNADVLQQTWSKLLKAYFDGKIDKATAEALAKRLGEPVTFTDPETGQPVKLTPEYAMKINDELRDAAFRDRIQAVWREAARKKYLEVAGQIP